MDNNRNQNCYHPLFIILFVLELLPPEVRKQIPRSTRNNWTKNNFSDAYGYEHCALYLKHFDDVSYAHKYTFVRSTLAIGIQIQKSILAISQSQKVYRKLFRTQASQLIEHITMLVKKGFPLSKACKLFGVKKSWYHYHKRRIICPQSRLKFCFKRHPNQLSHLEQTNIEAWIKKEENLGKSLTHLRYEALNKGIVSCSSSTFNHYAHKFGFQKVFRKPKAKHKKGFRAKATFEYLHIDTTFMPTLNEGVQKIAIVKDNFSKAPLHFIQLGTNETMDSYFISRLLRETFEKYKLYEQDQTIQIVSDDGSENKGEVLNWIASIKTPPCVKKITAKSDSFHYSNSMIEGSFHLFKHDFLKGKLPFDAKDCNQKLKEFIVYSQNRYFGELQGYTPLEVLNGAIPDKKRFKLQLEKAKQLRILENRNFKGCGVTSCE